MAETNSKFIVPQNYNSFLSIKETELAIKEIKDFFEKELAKQLNLTRISAPLFVRPETGLNDNLSGVERPVSFEVKAIDNNPVEIIHSLAKWKRMVLNRYDFKVGEGIYTDMNAIRRDETLGNLHSIYVDQWDWELIINKQDRNIKTLKDIVNRIFKAFKNAETHIVGLYPQIERYLPEDIYFITSQELEDMYPNLSSKERENAIARKKKAVFIMQIGGKLKSGKRHDGRAPDYDDWDLNGDIIFYYPLLDIAMEVSSMGIRVDEETLLKQLKITCHEERKELKFHKELLKGNLPYTVGGGIGQSRICMFFLGKAHIGEVQSSVWSDSMINRCKEANINLL